MTLSPAVPGGEQSIPTPARPVLHVGTSQAVIFADIEEIDASVWDSLVPPDDLQMTHRFVQACQHARIEDSVPRYALVYQQDRLAAIACFCSMQVRLELLASPRLRAITRAVRRVRPTFLRVGVLFCGLPVSFGQSAVRFAPHADRAAVVEAIRVVMASLADDLDTPMLCLKEVDGAESAALLPLVHAGFVRLPSLPFCSLPIRWASFEEYLDEMRSSYRRQLKADLDSRRRCGLTVRVVDDYASEMERIFALYEQVIERAPQRLERLNLAFFRELQQRMGKQSRAVLVECEGELVAAAVLLHTPQVLTFLLAGLDYERHQGCRAYPALTAELIALAIGSGAAVLELGQTSYALKSRFGAQGLPRFLYLRHRSAARTALLRRVGKWLFPERRPPPRRVFRNPVADSEGPSV